MTQEESDLFDRIHALVTRQVDQTLTERELHELEDLVIEDEQARHLYIEYMQELFHIASRLSLPNTGNLIADAGSFVPSSETNPEKTNPENASKSGLGVRWIAVAATAAAILLVGGLVGRATRTQPTNSSLVTQSESNKNDPRSTQVFTAQRNVATLTECSNVVWDKSVKEVSEYSRLAVGQNLHISEGRMKLIFDTGMETLILAPCSLTIHDRDHIFFHHGRISGRASAAGNGFVIETSAARVTDMGTEFGIATDDVGQTEVAVFEGEVNIEKLNATMSQKSVPGMNQEHLVQGEAARIGQDGRSSRISFIANTWLPTVREFAPARQSEPIIEAVYDNLTEQRPETRRFYRIVHGGFDEDLKAFVDRPHEWNGIDASGLPPELLGADYVMPFNDDKFFPELQVDISLSRPARLYLFLIDNVETPAWLTEDFVDTGINIGLDEGSYRYKPKHRLERGPGNSIDCVFSVWSRDVPQPQTISIGAIERPAKVKLGYCMYGIAAVELTPSPSSNK